LKTYFAIVFLLFAQFAIAAPPDGLVATAHAITPMMTCSRSAGTSPLAIVCSTVGTTSKSTDYPYHEIQYSWSFGDSNSNPTGVCGSLTAPGEGFWRCGSNPGANSKNTATGPVAGHVYEVKEGDGNKTFTVSVTMFDGVHTATRSQMITVADPASSYATSTICFMNAPGNTDPACPAGGTVVGGTSAFDSALASCLTRTSPRRCLFRRGDTFNTGTSFVATGGSVTIGAYGSGAQPIIVRTTETETAIKISSTKVNDLRIMDLEIKGATSSPADKGACISVSANVTNILLLRTRCHDIGKGVIMTGANGITGSVIQDSLIYNINAASGGVGIYGQATLSAYMGNHVGPFGTAAEHSIRCQPCRLVDISNNTITTPGTSGKTLLTIRAAEHLKDAGSYKNPDSQYIHIGDNKLIGTASIQMFQVAPASANQNNWISDVIAERNWIVFGAVTQQGYLSAAVRTTVRNNLCDASGGPSGGICFSTRPVDRTGNVPHPDRNSYFNNTCYDSAPGNSFYCILLDGSDTGHGVTHQVNNAVVENNLAHAPNKKAAYLVRAIPGTGSITGTRGTSSNASGNSSDTQVKSTRPWLAASPVNPIDFKPAGSYAAGGGIPVPVWSDFLLKPWTANRDMGALRH
jgi:hypothetical protein